MEERQRGYKRNPRFTKRLEISFTSGVHSFRGILSNISENGLFIRTNRGFAPGTIVDLELVLPGHTISRLKGIVRRTIKTPLTTMKNGMGIELIEKDQNYIDFFNEFLKETGFEDDYKENEERPNVEEKQNTPPEFLIISCANCGVKNKVSYQKISLGPKCGKCGASLPV
ncbi:MAG: PilZ domain-containing protein [Nitrospirae bacterium]|nr:PilZ domain-containing protein [Nitrospirota bacterium]